MKLKSSSGRTLYKDVVILDTSGVEDFADYGVYFTNLRS
jgi:hypothetical protein